MDWHHQLSGPTDPAADAGWADAPARKGFFTDTTICIGCKACEVACKEWNAVPEDGLALTGNSYDNTMALGASTWRHVAFIEQTAEAIAQAREDGRRLIDLGMPTVGPPRGGPDRTGAPTRTPTGTSREPLSGQALDEAEAAAQAAQEMGSVPDFRWLMASDVCKHCTHAACLDVCPTGALFRTEFGTVVVQADVCNGCGYCVGACPFGVIERRDGDKTVKNYNNAQKCTLCYDRLQVDETPACAKACPTTSIKFGDLDDLREQARERVHTLHENGFTEARLYGANENDGVGGTGAIFLLLDDPEVYGLPPDPIATTTDLPKMFRSAGMAAAAMLAGAALAFLGRRR